jgi:outer membrane receptor protein involved in Fe transport
VRPLDIRSVTIGICLCLASSLAAPAAEPQAVASAQETVEVTATRLPENPIEVPASIQIVSGEELERRQARTLGDALALVMGVSVAPGGDGGPASSVPEMMGLREFDAFLLVVDDVPWGGAFNPALATLDLTNIDRIEVVRGSAPVLYGATSFVGVIHVIHRAAGATPLEVRASGGSYGSFGANAFSMLPSSGNWHHSISAGYDETGYKDDHTNVDRAHLLYRGDADLGAGKFRLDFDTAIVNQDPASPFPRVGTSLTTLIPIDANHNTSDAKQDENRYHLVLGYSAKAFGGDWMTTLATTRSERKNIKGFLRADFDQTPPPASNADGFRQSVDVTDVYFDTHFATRFGDKVACVFGVDELYGTGTMDSENFEYRANLDGSGAPSSATIQIDERPHLEDTRSFAGLYAQAIWTPAPRWRVEAGARLNLTHESREAEVRPGDDGSGADPGGSDSRSDTRGSGSVGVSFRAWEKSGDSLWLFADYRNAFKPAAVDFGPEAEGELLEPEDADMYEGGLKGVNAGGHLTWEVSGYHMSFRNVVVATQVNGLPALENVGEENFDGVEAEASWSFAHDLRAQGSYAYHDSEFGDYLADFGDPQPQQLRGNRIEMSPQHLASLGVLYLPVKGFNANVIGQYVGSRFLNKRNTAPADSYTTWSAGVGYRFGHSEIRVDGVNLNDARDPVSESELGDAQYYLLPARTILATFIWRK